MIDVNFRQESMSEKHEWYLEDVVCIDNSNKTRHLGYHHDGQCKKKKISDAIPVEIPTWQ